MSYYFITTKYRATIHIRKQSHTYWSAGTFRMCMVSGGIYEWVGSCYFSFTILSSTSRNHIEQTLFKLLFFQTWLFALSTDVSHIAVNLNFQWRATNLQCVVAFQRWVIRGIVHVWLSKHDFRVIHHQSRSFTEPRSALPSLCFTQHIWTILRTSYSQKKLLMDRAGESLGREHHF